MTARNIELKARLASLVSAREIADRVATESLGTIRQRDTYFQCHTGRLKLRVIDGQQAQLIGYQRQDGREPRPSDYTIVEVSNAERLRQLLADSLLVLVEVEKNREVYLAENVRIHLDAVRGLGDFLEFEAVLGAGMTDEQGKKQVANLCREFRIQESQIVKRSYSDLMLERVKRTV